MPQGTWGKESALSQSHAVLLRDLRNGFKQFLFQMCTQFFPHSAVRRVQLKPGSKPQDVLGLSKLKRPRRQKFKQISPQIMQFHVRVKPTNTFQGCSESS